MRARIVPPCTILASGFVRTKPAYLKLSRHPCRNAPVRFCFKSCTRMCSKVLDNEFWAVLKTRVEKRTRTCAFQTNSTPKFTAPSVPRASAFISTDMEVGNAVSFRVWRRQTRSRKPHRDVCAKSAMQTLRRFLPLRCRCVPHYAYGRSVIMLTVTPTLCGRSLCPYVVGHSVLMWSVTPTLCGRSLRPYRDAHSVLMWTVTPSL